MVDACRRALYARQVKIEPQRERFLYFAKVAGATVVDAKIPIRAHLAQSRLKLNMGPQDGHLNALGVTLITGAAADAFTRP